MSENDKLEEENFEEEKSCENNEYINEENEERRRNINIDVKYADEYIKYCKSEIGLDKVDMKKPESKISWRKYIEENIGSEALPEEKWKGILKMMEKIDERKIHYSKESGIIKYFTDMSILCIYARLFETKSEKWFLFNKEESFLCFQNLISEISKDRKCKSKSSAYLRERTNFMESMENFLEDILKEYLDNVPEDVHEVSEDIIGIYMVNLHLKENYNKKEIFTNMDYKIILRMSKSGKIFNNVQSLVDFIIIKIFNDIYNDKILKNMREDLKVENEQRVAFNCLTSTLKGSLGGEHSAQKDEILESMLSFLEDYYPYIYKYNAAALIAEYIFTEIYEYKIHLSGRIKENLGNIYKKYFSSGSLINKLKLSPSMDFFFKYIKDERLPNLKITLKKLYDVSEKMEKETLESYHEFTVEEIKKAISEGIKILSTQHESPKGLKKNKHSPRIILLGCIKK